MKTDHSIPPFNAMKDADVVVLIHRPEFYGILEDRNGRSTTGRGELIVAKHRNGDTGTVEFGYNKSMTRIE
jgi:replicative DNA helicase